MADPFAPVGAGENLEIPAVAWNAMLRAAVADRRRQLGVEVGGRLPERGEAANLIGVQNVTAGMLPAFSIQRADGALVDPAKDPHGTRRRPIVVGATPAAATDPVCITVEAVDSGTIASAVVSGAAVCQVLVAKSTDKFVQPIPGVSGWMTTATSGYPLLAKGGAVEGTGGSGSGSGSGASGSGSGSGASGSGSGSGASGSGSESGSGSGSGSGASPARVWAIVLLGGGGGACGSAAIKSFKTTQVVCLNSKLKSIETTVTVYRDANGCVSTSTVDGPLIDLCVPCGCGSPGSPCACNVCSPGTGGSGATQMPYEWANVCIEVAGITGDWSWLNGLQGLPTRGFNCGGQWSLIIAGPPGKPGASMFLDGYMDETCNPVWVFTALDPRDFSTIFTGTFSGLIDCGTGFTITGFTAGTHGAANVPTSAVVHPGGCGSLGSVSGGSGSGSIGPGSLGSVGGSGGSGASGSCPCPGPLAGMMSVLYVAGTSYTAPWFPSGGTMVWTAGGYTVVYDPSLCLISPSGTYTLTGPGFGPIGSSTDCTSSPIYVSFTGELALLQI